MRRAVHIGAREDATIVRAVLLPSSMHLFGDWSWYLRRRSSFSPDGPPSALAAGESA